MKIRNILFIVLLIIEIVLLIFFSIKKMNYKVTKIVSIIVCVGIIISTGWIMIFPPYKEISPSGKYEVAYISENYIDEERIEEFLNDGSKRELQVGTWFPKNIDKKCPYVVFSHGSFGTIENNKTLCVELASRGFIVTSISHTYHAFETVLSNGTKVSISNSYMNEIMSENAHKDKKESLNKYQKWMKLRMDDLSFVIDTQKSKTSHEVFKNIDTSRIVVMGHSLGGSAALGIGRVRDDVKAVVALESPFMYDIVDVQNDEFVITSEEYPISCLNVYSDSSYTKLKDLPQYKQNYNLLNSSNSKYVNKYIAGIGHMHLCDFQLTSPFLSMILSGTDSKNNAKTNLELINDIVIDYLKSQEIM